MVPKGKVSPGFAVCVVLTEPASSVAVGSVHVTDALSAPVGAVTAMSDGQPVITGAVVSVEVAADQACYSKRTN